MPDLFDEANVLKKSKALTSSGGDLFDEMSVVDDRPELARPTFDKQAFFDEMNNSMSGLDKAMVGVGRGLSTIGRGFGISEPEGPSVRQAADSLSEGSNLAWGGEIVGEALPFLAAAPASAGLAGGRLLGGKVLIPAAQKLLTRIGIGATIGAAEGAAIAKGKGGNTSEIVAGGAVGSTVAGAVEALIPVLGRLGGAVFRKLNKQPKGPLLSAEGAPTQEFLEALKETGTTFDALTDDAVDFIASQKSGASPTEVSRLSRFKSLGIPATKGDISQDFAQQASESRLASMAGDESAEPLRQFRLEQSDALTGKITELVDSLGIPSEAGETVKAALSGRKKLLFKQKNALYKEIAAADPGVAEIPILGNDIVDSMLDDRTMRRLGRRDPQGIGALDSLLVEFGINKSDEAVEAFTKNGDEIFPLTMGNLEDFRQELNAISRESSAASVATKPVIDALDGEAQAIDDILEKFAGGGILETSKKARKTVRTIKTEFSPQSIAGRLIDVKRDGITPVVEASRVVKEMTSKPVEQLDLTMKSLQQSGSKGRKAIGDMRAAVILGAMEDALKAPSRKTSGVETFGGNQFVKSLRKFGDDKLEILFRGDKGSLDRLQALGQTALDINPTANAMPKGSAPALLDLAKRASLVPVLAPFIDLVSYVVKAGADERAVRKAITAKPAFKRVALQLESDFPSVASALGIAGIVGQEEEQ